MSGLCGAGSFLIVRQQKKKNRNKNTSKRKKEESRNLKSFFHPVAVLFLCIRSRELIIFWHQSLLHVTGTFVLKIGKLDIRSHTVSTFDHGHKT